MQSNNWSVLPWGLDYAQFAAYNKAWKGAVKTGACLCSKLGLARELVALVSYFTVWNPQSSTWPPIQLYTNKTISAHWISFMKLIKIISFGYCTNIRSIHLSCSFEQTFNLTMVGLSKPVPPNIFSRLLPPPTNTGMISQSTWEFHKVLFVVTYCMWGQIL